MRRRRALGLCAALPLVGASPPLHAAPAAPGQVVAWPEVTLLDGSRWGPEQARGKPVVVVFWSTTCPFCLRHNAHLEKLRQATASKGLQILTVAREQEAARVQAYLSRHGYRFAVTLDQAAMAAVLSPRKVIPLTVTVDSRGHLRQVIPGEMFEEDMLELARIP